MPDTITLGNLSISRDRYDVRIGDQRIGLTYLEFELLHLLARQPGRVLSREDICAGLWGEDAGNANKLTVHVSRLRKKMACSRWWIQTVKKRGYALADIGPSSGNQAAAFNRR